MGGDLVSSSGRLAELVLALGDVGRRAKTGKPNQNTYARSRWTLWTGRKTRSKRGNSP